MLYFHETSRVARENKPRLNFRIYSTLRKLFFYLIEKHKKVIRKGITKLKAGPVLNKGVQKLNYSVAYTLDISILPYNWTE